MRQQQQRRNNGGTAKVQNVDKRTNKISFAAPRKLRACSMYVSAKCTTCIVRASKCVSERASVCLCAAQMLAQCSSVCVSMPLTSSERETNASYKISTKRDAKGRRRGVGSTKRAERAALLFAQHKRSHGCQCSPTCTTHVLALMSLSCANDFARQGGKFFPKQQHQGSEMEVAGSGRRAGTQGSRP